MDIFIHIHKSGGTTLMRLLNQVYEGKKVFSIDGERYNDSIKEYLSLPPETRDTYDLVKGHMFFGVHQAVSSDARYFTMLRDPMSKTVSLYNYLKEIDLYPELNRKKMDIRTFLESGQALAADNGMTRFLSGTSLAEVPYGKMDSGLVEKAKENLKTHFVVAGLMRYFDETLLLYKEKLGWDTLPNYFKRNVTGQKVASVSTLTEAEKAFIRDFCKPDFELYAFVQAEFEKTLAGQGPGFQSAVEAYRKGNLELQEKLESGKKNLFARGLDWLQRKF
jgi:hypothetical protein